MFYITFYISFVHMNKINLKTFFHSILKEKNITISDLAENTLKSQAGVSNILNKKTMNFKTFQELMNGLNEDVVLTLKNGNNYLIDNKI